MIKIAEAQTEPDIEHVRRLFTEYAEELDFDLCFQGFQEELAALPGCYAPPEGFLLLAREGDQLAGCVALGPLKSQGQDVCEMRRLYVRADFRGRHIGSALVKAIVEKAKLIGYRRMLLHTLPSMKAAVALYESLGFAQSAPYFESPIPSVKFLQRPLTEASHTVAKG